MHARARPRTWAVVVLLVALACWQAITTYDAAAAAPRVLHGATSETFVQPIQFGQDGRWLRLTSLTVTPTAEVVRGVMHLEPGDQQPEPALDFAPGQPFPTQSRFLPVRAAARGHTTWSFRLMYPRRYIIPATHGRPIQALVWALTFARYQTLSRTLTLPLPPHGVVLGRVPGATVRLKSVSAAGVSLTIDYGPLRHFTYWSGIFGIGATPIHNRISAVDDVTSLTLRTGRHVETAESYSGVTISFPVTYSDLSWSGSARLPKAGARFTLAVPVYESYTVPRSRGGVTWPKFPWWWRL